MRQLRPFLLILLAACAAEPSSVDPGLELGETQSELSAIRRLQMATRVFRQTIGRDPSPAELQPMKDMTLPQMVDAVLASPDYAHDGFYAFQRERLLLHRDGNETWKQGSRNDYCALRIEMDEMAQEDATGAGYFQMLRYKRRWVPMQSYYMGLPLACWSKPAQAFKDFFDLAEAGADPASLPQDVLYCLQSSSAGPRLAADLETMSTAELALPLVQTTPGKAMWGAAIGQAWMSKPGVGAVLPATAAVDAKGLPLVRTYANGPSEDCETVDAWPVAQAAYADVIFVAIVAPDAIAGVHASPYWLGRHPTTPQNRNLHRARMTFFSYMCTDVTPAMAEPGGGDPVLIPELEPYFSADDIHARSSANCYNCHTRIQPVANYFGELMDQSAYQYGYSNSGFYSGQGFRRPGGLWQGKAFNPNGAGEFGMKGFADALSSLDVAHQCIVRRTWSTLVGSGHPLNRAEVDQAVQAFKGDGTFRFARLLRHLSTENGRGKAFFEGGEKQLSETPPAESPDCHDVDAMPDFASDAPQSVMTEACSGCHTKQASSRGFWERKEDNSSVWNPERLVPEFYPSKAALYHRLYCKVWNGDMPVGGWDGAVESERQTLCHLAAKRNLAARASDDVIEQSYDAKPCIEETTPPSDGPHPIGPVQ